ncbi:hypothetical protein [Lewinella sp. IMCC34191]|uniref:hypothetical protein n=1 Tax=Lewinella sp. IMCC34191 TaxID=2259172 RepID=UPI001300A5A0|nr:hypothetical protein [Lewinella sp. IMCC34191]
MMTRNNFNINSLIGTLLFTLAAAAPMLAQQQANITETTTEYDKQRLSSMTISIDAPVDAVYDPWEEFWEERYDIDIDRSDKDGSSIAYLAEEILMTGVSTQPVYFYSNVDGTDERSTVSISVALDQSKVITRQNDAAAFKSAGDKLREFETYFYTRYFDEQLAEVRDELEDARDDREDASSDANKARKKIRKYEEKIKDLREKIEETREEVGEELEDAEENEQRVLDLEAELERIQRSRRNYLG